MMAGLLALAFFLVGFPPQYLVEKISERNIIDPMYWAMKDGNVIDKGIKNLFVPRIERVNAANFSMQTGYYVGDNSANHAITGLGFQPEMVLIKDNTASGAGVWKSSAMPAANLAYFAATADNTTSLVSLTADGFSVKSNNYTNLANDRYVWVAFAGSDCTASGTICIGSYTGNGSSPRAFTTGFQPAFVMVKRSTAVAANFRTSSMPNNYGNYFTTTAQVTNGALFTTLGANGFTVGATNNVNGGSYYYVAFKAGSGVMAEGTYAGTGGDNVNITGFGAGSVPNFVFTKNVNAATAANRSAYFNVTDSYGDHSSRMDALTANTVNIVQKLQDDGFQIGSSAISNGAGNTIYWVGLGGAPPAPSGSGTFSMAEGTYAGTGIAQSITTVGFRPDLVVIKHRDQPVTEQHSVFRTSMMAGDSTAYVSSATANFATGITSLDANGFSVGVHATVNTSGDTYHFVAYGNAWRPDTKSGAADFIVGTYSGNGVAVRDITGMPFQPNIVVIKRFGASYGVFRTSSMVGDVTNAFSAAAALAGGITALNIDGFQLGNNAVIATAGNRFNYFAFKSGPNFTVNQYTGTGGDNVNISTVGFNPDFVWTKKQTGGTARGAVQKDKFDSGEETRPVYNAAVILTNAIQNFLAANNGFQVGTAVTVNENTFLYDYAAWKIPLTFQQSSYRLFANTDTTDVGAVLAAGDVGASLANTGDPFRLRMTIHVNGDTGGRLDASEENFKLQFASSTDTCDTGFSGENYIDVGAATEIAFKNNTPADGAALTNNANDPPVAGNPHAGHTIVNQTYEEANNFTNSTASVLVGQDGKWDFALYDNGATPNMKYCFRAVKSDDSFLESYSVIPEITTATIPTFAQNYFRFYEDNDALKPTVPWAGLGEIANITASANPLAVGEKLRLRMTLLSGEKNAPALSQSFRLQYGKQITSCGAIAGGNWTNIGAPGSGTIWRGVNATPVSGTPLSGTNPPTAGDLLLSGADRAGTYEESSGTSAPNPYGVAVGEEIEYDWMVQNNGADTMSDYCFRMATGTVNVMSAYSYYPTIRTAGFRPKTENWQWFDDAENETPAVSLGNEEVSPSDIAYDNSVKLRVAVKETAAVAGANVKFKLQFSEYSDFSAGVTDVVDPGVCTENSLWCFADGGGAENAVITAKKLSGVDACSGGVGNGCGMHNEASSTPSAFTQNASAVTEYEFAIRHAGARANRTYYFRLYDTENGVPVLKDAGRNFPSLATEGARISFSVSGLPSGTNTEGTVTNVGTGATAVSFGSMPFDTNITGAQRFTVSTNATEGYQIFVRGTSDFLSDKGGKIDSVTGTNASPSLWSVGCDILAVGCFGYHAGDDILSGGSTRFLLNNNFAKLSTTAHEEIAFSSVPVTNEVTDIVFQTQVTELQPSGNYGSSLYYIVVPVF
jgi:hypothetical protein